MSEQHLKEGIDPTAYPCITPSVLLQFLRNAQPFPDQGFIIWRDTAPDVVSNPEESTFLWGSTVAGVPTGDIYYYTGTSWELLPINFVDGSINLSKLSLTGSSPNFIIQVNSLGTALIWTSVINAIANNTIPPIKLLTPDAINNYVLTSLAGTKAFTSISALVGLFADNSIALSKLVKGSANRFLRMKPDGSAPDWLTVDVSDLLAATSSAYQVPRRNLGNTGWEYYTPGISYIAPVQVAALNTVTTWATVNITGNIPLADRASVKGVILYIDSLTTTSGGGPDTVHLLQGRASSLGNVYDLTQSRANGSGPGVVPCIGQFQLPVAFAAGVVSLDLQQTLVQTSSGSDTISTTVKLIGYTT